MFIFLVTSKVKKVLMVSLILLAVSGLALLLNLVEKDSMTTKLIFASRVKPDVIFLKQNIGKYARPRVEELVTAELGAWQLEPLDAVYDSNTHAVVPELWGYRVNLEGTVEEIMSAGAGEEIWPVLDPLLPEVSIADYPSSFLERGHPLKKEISFMVNVAWGTEFIVPLLRILEFEKVPANFFVVGEWAQKNENLLREMSKKGHLLANHGHTDRVTYPELSSREMEDGLKAVNDLVQTATGENVLFFTPHKGEYNDLVLQVVARQGMRTVLWSLDTVDWANPGLVQMKSKILENMHPGAIILMHPTEDTVSFLRETIPIIKERGFSIVTLKQLFSPDYPQRSSLLAGSQ